MVRRSFIIRFIHVPWIGNGKAEAVYRREAFMPWIIRFLSTFCPLFACLSVLICQAISFFFLNHELFKIFVIGSDFKCLFWFNHWNSFSNQFYAELIYKTSKWYFIIQDFYEFDGYGIDLGFMCIVHYQWGQWSCLDKHRTQFIFRFI